MLTLIKGLKNENSSDKISTNISDELSPCNESDYLKVDKIDKMDEIKNNLNEIKNCINNINDKISNEFFPISNDNITTIKIDIATIKAEIIIFKEIFSDVWDKTNHKLKVSL